MGAPIERSSDAVAARRVGISGLSAPVGGAVLANAVIVVTNTLVAVTACIANLIMLMVVVSLRSIGVRDANRVLCRG